MAKVVFFSDLHIHSFPEFGATERLQDCVSVLTDIRKYCVEHAVKHVFFGGDLMHKRGILWTAPYVAVADELLAFKQAGIEFYAVDGNHDHEDKAGRTHALQPLMAGGLLRGIGSEGFLSVKVNNVHVTMFAYCDSKDVLASRIKAMRAGLKVDKAHHIALFHHGFKGARVGSSLEYEVREPIDAKELRLDKLFGLVFSGHYHTHQAIVGVRRGWYIGSPLEHTRSDRTDDTKGFLVVDTKTLGFRKVSLRRPRFVSVEVGENIDEIATGNFVDIIYAKADSTLDAFAAEVRKRGARGVNLVPLASAKTTTVQRLDISPALAPEKVLRRYVKHRKRELKKQKLDATAIMELGLELVRSAE